MRHFSLLVLTAFVIATTIILTTTPLGYAIAPEFHKVMERKTAKAMAQLNDAVERGYDVSSIVPKMQRVKQLANAGLFEDAGALLDDILTDFEALYAIPSPNGSSVHTREDEQFTNDRRVTIHGYSGDAMEVFISRDGQYLFFNNLKTPGRSKDLYFAEKLDAYNFQFRGEITPINTPAVEGVPSADRNGVFYYLSTYAYSQRTPVTMYQGQFSNGTVSNIIPLPELSLNKPGWLNMDSEISEDGKTLYSTHSYFKLGETTPQKSYFFYAKQTGNGFLPQADSAAIFQTLNRDTVVYGASLSKNELEIFYTRLVPGKPWPETLVATRSDKTMPFGEPAPIRAITGFAEAPALNEDESLLYYHKQSTITGRFYIHVLQRINQKE